METEKNASSILKGRQKPVIILLFADEKLIKYQQLQWLKDEEYEINRLAFWLNRIEVMEAVIIPDATFEKIQKAFTANEGRVVGFHVSGHGGKDVVYLESRTSAPGENHHFESVPIRLEALHELLLEQKTIKFAVLNFCESADFARRLSEGWTPDTTNDPIRKQVSEPLIEQGARIPFTIGNTVKAMDRDCRDLSTRFYETLFYGQSLQQAFRTADLMVNAHDAPYRQAPAWIRFPHPPTVEAAAWHLPVQETIDRLDEPGKAAYKSDIHNWKIGTYIESASNFTINQNI